MESFVLCPYIPCAIAKFLVMHNVYAQMSMLNFEIFVKFRHFLISLISLVLSRLVAHSFNFW